MNSSFCQIASAIVGLSTAIAIFETIRSWLRLRHIPGPPLAGFSRLWLVWNSLKGRLAYATEEASGKYGSLVRVGPNEIISSDPDVWRKILGVRTEYRRSDWFESIRWNPDGETLGTTLDNQAHKKLRSQLAPGYSGKESNDHEKTMDRTINKFVNFLGEKYLSTENAFRQVDISEKLQYFSVEVISNLAFGKPFGNLDRDEDSLAYIHTTTKHLPLIGVAGFLPWLIRIVRSPIIKGIISRGSDAMGLGEVVVWSENAISERLAAEKRPVKDILDSFISHGLTKAQLEGEMVGVM
ncbi:Cytochrome P450 monooxygenase mpaDE [Lachnellula suecica]|uniref:Cytochrome P450 monooxygenase mpaDE n=1 Tax=Lachnellula suecica TaxID=602035 RepID=A0A8T9BXC0_9HELO|nr:Cytochrome P450 monooxygenase mpaDE [Lachnellula suecica]